MTVDTGAPPIVIAIGIVGQAEPTSQDAETSPRSLKHACRSPHLLP